MPYKNSNETDTPLLNKHDSMSGSNFGDTKFNKKKTE
jgi:hypothetical protein